MTNMKKGLLFLIFTFSITYFTIAQDSPNEADAIIGTWLMPDDEWLDVQLKHLFYGKSDQFL